MSWNLFDRIINALKPNREPEQEPETPQSWPQESEQTSDTSQSWPEGSTEQPEASQEPSPEFQETTNPAKPNKWQED
ncbi:MAG: hypothetical protein ACYS30_09030 [Planctomycetota bacterium]|jgi:hypothetical protein